MKGVLLVAASAALVSAPADASVVFERSGTGYFEVLGVDLAPGKYAFQVDFDRPVQPSFYFEFQTSYDYVCRPDQGHPAPYLCGGETNPFELDLKPGPRTNSYRATATLMPARFVPDAGSGSFLGTRYLRDRFVGGGVSPGDSDPLAGYHFVIDALPEPATWAMMILGFGAAGIAARRAAWPTRNA